MITAHVTGQMIGKDFDHSYEDTESVDYTGSLDFDEKVRSAFFDMKKKGFINLQVINEDSQVPVDCAMPELRFSKPYMFNNGGNKIDYVADMDCNEIGAYFEMTG
jgi:hypothetical protein